MLIKPAIISAEPYGGIISPFADRLLPLFFVTGLLFVMGGFVLQLSQADLTVDPNVGAGSLLSQVNTTWWKAACSRETPLFP